MEPLARPARARAESRLLASVALLAALFSVLAALQSARQQDWTFDEGDHLAWSRRLLATGETERRTTLQFNSKTPIVVPNVLAQRRLSNAVGWGEMEQRRLAARLPTVAWLALLLAAIWWVTWRVAGAPAAHMALVLAAVEPNLVANGSIVSVDVAFTLLSVLSLAASFALAQRPGWARALLLGLALGLAFVAKFSAFLLLPLLALAVLLALRAAPAAERAGRLRAAVGWSAAAGLVALVVLCAGYGFAGVGAPLSSRTWRGGTMQALAELAPGLPSPVPIDFLTGVDITTAQERAKDWPVLILGQRHPPVPYYYLLQWALKTPLALMAAELAGLALLWRVRPRVPAVDYAALSLGALLLYFCLLFRAQIGYRHALLCVPLVCFLAGIGLASRRWRAAAAVGVLVLAAAEQAPYLGNHLAFTNLLVWPKQDAWRWLGDSSIDYRQNDDQAEAWVRTQPGAHLDPVHILPGRNVFGITRLYAPEHDWVRAHLRAAGHFRYSHVYFDVDEPTFRTFLEAERRLDGSPDDEALCAPPLRGTPAPEARVQLEPPGTPGRVTLACLEVTRPAAVALRSESGFAGFGTVRQRRKVWPFVAPQGEAWFWARPGVHAILLVAQKGSFTGRFSGDPGLSVWLRPVQLGPRGYLPGLEPPTDDDEP